MCTLISVVECRNQRTIRLKNEDDLNVRFYSVKINLGSSLETLKGPYLLCYQDQRSISSGDRRFLNSFNQKISPISESN